jgi:glycosyltransferase involved in cell wall biosynthesis
MTGAKIRPVPVTAVVLTYNEERNIAACLESLTSWASAVFVVDSGSSDATVRIAEQAGATVVSHAFETHAAQWRWALATLPIATEWVLAIDADQRVTPPLADAIARAVAAPGEAAGVYVNRRQVFRGRWIKHGGYYPKLLLKLFKRSRVSVDAGDLVDHHFVVDGPTIALREDLVEDNRNEAEIAVWTAKHNRYAVLQARQELAASSRPKVGASALVGSPDARVLYLKQLWARLPLYWRPCLYVFYRYVLRLGFLDGKQGFIFHVLQAFWYRLLVDVNIDELRAKGLQAPSADPSMDPAGPIGVEAPRR